MEQATDTTEGTGRYSKSNLMEQRIYNKAKQQNDLLKRSCKTRYKQCQRSNNRK